MKTKVLLLVLLALVLCVSAPGDARADAKSFFADLDLQLGPGLELKYMEGVVLATVKVLGYKPVYLRAGGLLSDDRNAAVLGVTVSVKEACGNKIEYSLGPFELDVGTFIALDLVNDIEGGKSTEILYGVMVVGTL